MKKNIYIVAEQHEKNKYGKTIKEATTATAKTRTTIITATRMATRMRPPTFT